MSGLRYRGDNYNKGYMVDYYKKLLLIGSGGREHSLAWKLVKSEKVDFWKILQPFS